MLLKYGTTRIGTYERFNAVNNECSSSIETIYNEWEQVKSSTMYVKPVYKEHVCALLIPTTTKHIQINPCSISRTCLYSSIASNQFENVNILLSCQYTPVTVKATFVSLKTTLLLSKKMQANSNLNSNYKCIILQYAVRVFHWMGLSCIMLIYAAFASI